MATTVLPTAIGRQVGDLDAEADRGLPRPSMGPRAATDASSQSCTSRGVASTGTSPVARASGGVSLGDDQFGVAAGTDDDGHGYHTVGGYPRPCSNAGARPSADGRTR